jgi:serine/threonine protein kinase
MVLPKYYAMVNIDKPPAYTDYKHYNIEYGDASRYVYMREIGSGTFGVVY